MEKTGFEYWWISHQIPTLQLPSVEIDRQFKATLRNLSFSTEPFEPCGFPMVYVRGPKRFTCHFWVPWATEICQGEKPTICWVPYTVFFFFSTPNRSAESLERWLGASQQLPRLFLSLSGEVPCVTQWAMSRELRSNRSGLNNRGWRTWLPVGHLICRSVEVGVGVGTLLGLKRSQEGGCLLYHFRSLLPK